MSILLILLKIKELFSKEFKMISNFQKKSNC